MRKILLSVLSVLFLAAAAIGQNKQVTGTVTDEKNSPLAGVSVIVKGTQTGVTTDTRGKFQIPAPQDASLEFSFVGMVSRTVPIAGKQVIDVSMVTDALSLEQVVVTAMGITRAEKSLGYSVSSLSSDDIEAARENSLINSLQGKVAGVNIANSSGTPGGGSKIIIRGQSSLSGSGQPIFVVDGLPVSNASYNPEGITGTIDAGTRIGDLSVNDIGSISILKGAAATALYGARAKDGAIIITTKRGQKGRTEVTFNSSVRFDRPLKLPDFQNEYTEGSGTSGNYVMGNGNGWGPKISEMTDPVKIFTGDEVMLQAYPDNVKEFYETGHTYINSLSVSGADDQGDFRLGFSSHNQNGIIPGNLYDKYNFTVNAGRKLGKMFSARVSATYANVGSEGRPAQGSNDANVLVPMINNMPRTMDPELLKNNWITAEGKPYTLDDNSAGKAIAGNPYWNIYKNKFTNKVDRFTGSAILTFTPIKNLSINNNLGLDYYKEDRRQIYAKNTISKVGGAFNTYDITSRIINNDLIATYDLKFCHDKFGIKIIAGNNIYENEYKTLVVQSQNLQVDGVYSYANAATNSPRNAYSKNRLVGVYGDIGFSYKDFAFINITGRNDWSSTMPENHKSYFYPSVSGSLLFTELLPKNKVLSYGKLRVNYANVGSDTPPYTINFAYSPVSSYFLQFWDENVLPHGGLIAFRVPGTNPNPEIEPQNQRAFEVGTDLRLFDGRITLDVSYYSNKTTNSIVPLSIPPSTGYGYFRTNAGTVTNKGMEIMLGVTPIKRGVTWDINFNFATNEQKVVELADGVSAIDLTSGWSGLIVKAAVGEPFSIFGTGWITDDQGNYVINPSTGLRATEAGKNLGKITPDWTLGIYNSVSWKGLSVAALVDIRQGGVMYSSTVSNLRTSGLAKETLDRAPRVDPGVYVDGTRNTKEISGYTFWSGNYPVNTTEANIFDASYVKLRELTVSYTLPNQWIKGLGLKDLSIGLEGRNLWIIDSAIPHIDPELSFFAPGTVGSSVEFASIPSTRSLGFNVKFSF